MASYDEETEPDELVTQEDVELMTAQLERFNALVTGKSLDDVVKPEFLRFSEVFLRLATQKVMMGEPLLMHMLVAMAWGMFVAEHGGSKLDADLTNLQ